MSTSSHRDPYDPNILLLVLALDHEIKGEMGARVENNTLAHYRIQIESPKGVISIRLDDRGQPEMKRGGVLIQEIPKDEVLGKTTLFKDDKVALEFHSFEAAKRRV